MQKGLAVVKTNGLEFDRNASHEDVVESLTELLPSVFGYFARIQGDGQPAWCLATPLRNKLRIVPSSHPDGAVLDYNKGNGTTGFRNNRIFLGKHLLFQSLFCQPSGIVTIDPVPAELLREWKAEWAGANKSSFRKPLASNDGEF